MGAPARLLIATAISLILLLIYDRLVIKPRIQNKIQNKVQENKAPEEKTEIKEEYNLIDIQQPIKTKAYTSLEDPYQRITFSNNGIKKIELLKFSLQPNSPERYFFDSPLDIFFISNGKIINFSSEVSGNSIYFYYDNITGTVSIEKNSNYSFTLLYQFFNSSTINFIDITPLFIIRKSVVEDSNFVVISSKVEKLKDIKNIQNINFIGEDSRYFSFIFHVPGGVSPIGSSQNVFRGQKLSGERYASFYIKIFSGPKIPEELSNFSPSTEALAGYGFLGPISELLIFLLNQTDKLAKNMGISIIIISILIRLIFFPLSAISFKSFKKIKEIQPEIEKIKEKYKDDKERMSREIFEIYRREKINPFSGCLPLLIQIPIFIALYNALMHSVELRHAPFFLWIKDLSEPESIFHLSIFGNNIHIRLLPILMGLSFFVQQIITPQTYQDRTMQIINYLTPLIFVFILWNVPSGLQIYWITTNIFGILQQLFVMKFYK